jgi:hypothetical protein
VAVKNHLHSSSDVLHGRIGHRKYVGGGNIGIYKEGENYHLQRRYLNNIKTPDLFKNKASNFNFDKQSYVSCTTLGQPVIPNE